MGILINLYTSFSVQAQTGTGSLQLQVYGTAENDGQVVLADTIFELFQVADYKNEEYILREEFEQSEIKVDASLSSAEQKGTAQKLYDFVQENELDGAMQRTDEEGCIRYTGLTEGVYLIVQKTPFIYENGTMVSSPFLISVPTEINGQILYDVKVEPKTEWIPPREESEIQETLPTETEENMGTEESVKTGDESYVELYFAILFSGLIILNLSKRQVSKSIAENVWKK